MTILEKSIIRFHNVKFGYGISNSILNNVNIDIKQGGFYFLTGKSGVGKTSLLKLMYIGNRITDGNLFMFDKDVDSYSRNEIALIRQNISVVFQDYKLLKHLNVFDNLALPLRIKGDSEETIVRKVTQIVKWVGLKQYIDSYPDILSGGQQQRLSIARSVITNPKIILADEPTGSVDEVSAKKIFSLFEQLHKRGTTIIMATHNENLVKSKNYPKLVIENNSVFLEK